MRHLSKRVSELQQLESLGTEGTGERAALGSDQCCGAVSLESPLMEQSRFCGLVASDRVPWRGTGTLQAVHP